MRRPKRRVKPNYGPGRLLLRQAEDLFPNESERKAFVDALMAGASKEQAIIVLEERGEVRMFPRQMKQSWQPDFAIRIADSFRATKHQLYEKGAFYSLDLSSVFSASAMLAIPTPPRTVIDLCSSPGGKAIFSYIAFKPSLLYCNETIRKRATTLINNLNRCHVEGSVVWSADPSVYAKKFPQRFELAIVDAPCSGQSLLAKGEDPGQCFSPEMIDMCVGRQRRILANAAQCITPGGHILYATCTYSIKENEKIIKWVLETHDWLEAVEVPALAKYRSKYSEEPCYRLFPQEALGAGAFAALLRRKGELPAETISAEELPHHWKYGEPWPPIRTYEQEPHQSQQLEPDHSA